jgi:hypothetical protein
VNVPIRSDPIYLPDNSPLSIGKDHNRPNRNLFHSRVGIVSLYETDLLSAETDALYNDYKIFYPNIPLISDALLTCDLTKSSNVTFFKVINTEYLILNDTSGNGTQFPENLEAVMLLMTERLQLNLFHIINDLLIRS